MKLSAPKKVVFWIAVILFIIALIAYFIPIPFLTATIIFWLPFIGGLLLILGCVLKGF